MLIIGESLNASIPKVGQAIAEQNEEFITKLALRQVECGAKMLDVNAGGLGGRNECEDLSWMVRLVQSVTEVPLVLDSANPECLHEVIDVYQGKEVILSSITSEQKRIEELVPLAAERGCSLIGLCMGENGIPAEPEGRVALAEIMIERVIGAGLKPEALYIDPIVMTISADWHAGAVTLETLRLLRDRFPDVRTISIIGNIAFMMPGRSLLNRMFLAMTMAIGTDALMVNVRDQELMGYIKAAALLTGKDEWCREYIKAYRAGELKVKSNAGK